MQRWPSVASPSTGAVYCDPSGVSSSCCEAVGQALSLPVVPGVQAMSKNRRCYLCNKLIDPEQDEAYLLLKGVGSRTSNMQRVLWLCPRHGDKYKEVLDAAREGRLRTDKYGKIVGTNAS